MMTNMRTIESGDFCHQISKGLLDFLNYCNCTTINDGLFFRGNTAFSIFLISDIHLIVGVL
jgi:hypothetical protein